MIWFRKLNSVVVFVITGFQKLSNRISDFFLFFSIRFYVFFDSLSLDRNAQVTIILITILPPSWTSFVVDQPYLGQLVYFSQPLPLWQSPNDSLTRKSFSVTMLGRACWEVLISLRKLSVRHSVPREGRSSLVSLWRVWAERSATWSMTLHSLSLMLAYRTSVWWTQNHKRRCFSSESHRSKRSSWELGCSVGWSIQASEKGTRLESNADSSKARPGRGLKNKWHGRWWNDDRHRSRTSDLCRGSQKCGRRM